MKFHIARFVLIFSFSFFLFSCEEENTEEFDDPRDKLLGTWDVSEGCTKDAYSIEIIKDPLNSAYVLIRNFWNMGSSASPPSALVVGDKLYFDKSKFFDMELEVTGEGLFNKNTIAWQYEVFDGADVYSCEAVYTLQ
jgi:hypothetical protein